jgi:polar amino acid transport system substrate-binding protein
MRALIYLLLGCILFVRSLSAETIRITNGEWAPYLSQYSYQYGVDSHIVSEAFKLEGITVEWGFFPWQRAYQYAEMGEGWDASCCWWPDDKIDRAFLSSDTVSTTSFVFFHLKSYNLEWQSLHDLQGITVGVTSKYNYGKELMHVINEKNIEVDLTSKDEFNYKKLLAKRIEVFPNDRHVGNAQMKSFLSASEADLITHHPKEFGVNTLHLIININNKRSKYLLNKFNAGLEKLKASGRYQQMLNDMKTGKYDKQKTLFKP